MNAPTRRNPTFASLFCGCGGFDLGFSDTGFRCIAAYDIDSAAIRVHRENLCSPAEIKDLSDRQIPLGALKDLDVLIAGPPCQGFSTAGKRNLNDPRNALLITTAEMAGTHKPKVVVVENVAAVRFGSHRAYWEALISSMRTSGYKTAELLCTASEHGLAQMRKRVVLLAWRTSKDISFNLPELPSLALIDALANVEGSPDHNPKLLQPNSDMGKIARRIKPGQKLCNVRNGDRSIHTWEIPEVFGAVTEDERLVLESLVRLRRRLRLRSGGDADPVLVSDVSKDVGFASRNVLSTLVAKSYVRRIGNRFDICHTFNGKFRRLSWKHLSYTVDTRFIDPRYFLHPEEDRGFTIREAARIQGFPDTFKFYGSTRDQIRMIGNAVPPPLARKIAEFVLELL